MLKSYCEPVAAGAKKSIRMLVNGIFVKIKPNFLSSGDIARASTLISTCLSTDELLLSGTRVVENAPITRGPNISKQY